MAEQCPDCSISSDGQLDEDEMYVKGTALAERASRRAKVEELAIDLEGLVMTHERSSPNGSAALSQASCVTTTISCGT